MWPAHCCCLHGHVLCVLIAALRLSSFHDDLSYCDGGDGGGDGGVDNRKGRGKRVVNSVYGDSREIVIDYFVGGCLRKTMCSLPFVGAYSNVLLALIYCFYSLVFS